LAPKRKGSDAGSASKPKGSRDVLSISEKVKILDMIEIEKIVCGDCQVVWQERIFHSRSDEKQRNKFVLVFLLHRKLQKLLQ
jgi:transcription initiation factor TFIIIB Brf1 subunit/transcription initiation factor TFIIB